MTETRIQNKLAAMIGKLIQESGKDVPSGRLYASLEFVHINQMTKAQTAAMIGKLIQESGKDGVPSGRLYASLVLMWTNSHFNIEKYNRYIEILKKAGLIEERDYVLTWIG